jgi:hypothetical protein
MSMQAERILRYFLRNPRAADTADGLALWRLPGGSSRNAGPEVLAALEWLVAERLVRAERRRAAGVIYSLSGGGVRRGGRSRRKG